jgi:hypothetical protein
MLVPSPTVPARGSGPTPDRPALPARRHRPHRDHPSGVGQRPHRGLLPAGLRRSTPRRPDRHRPAPPHRPPGLPRRPADSHRAASQHQGGGPTPRPPAQTTQDQLGKCQPSPGTKPKTSTGTRQEQPPALAADLRRFILPPKIRPGARAGLGTASRRSTYPCPATLFWRRRESRRAAAYLPGRRQLPTASSPACQEGS